MTWNKWSSLLAEMFVCFNQIIEKWPARYKNKLPDCENKKQDLTNRHTRRSEPKSSKKCVRWRWDLNVMNCDTGSFNYCLDSSVAGWHRLFVWRLSWAPGTPDWSRFTLKNSEFHEKIIRSYCVPHKPAPPPPCKPSVAHHLFSKSSFSSPVDIKDDNKSTENLS